MSPEPKHPPHSIDAEMSVLGGMMLDNRTIPDVAELLESQDFYLHAHRLIFLTVMRLAQENQPADFLTVLEALRVSEKLEEAGGLAYVGTLCDDTPSAMNVVAYAQIVRERSILRALIATGQDIAGMGFNPEGRDALTLLDIAEQRLFEMRRRGERVKQGPQPFNSVLQVTLTNIEERENNKGQLAGLTTGLVDLDAKIGGLRAGQLIVVGARPGMGKSVLGGNLAEACALQANLPALIFTMEMSAEEMAQRIISSQSKVPLHFIRNGGLNNLGWNNLAKVTGKLGEAPIWIDDTPALSPNELRARARRVAGRHGLGLIVVDYIQLMQVPGERNRVNEISEISRQLKRVGKELGVPVVALSQLNRSVEQRDNKRPRTSDLRESGGIEQDADVVIFVYRDEYYYDNSPDKGQAELTVGKQRSGPLGPVHVAFRGEVARFDNLAPGNSRGAHAPPDRPTDRGF